MNALMRDFKRIIHVGLCIIHRDISHNLPIVWLQCPWLSLDTWNNETCAIKLIVLLTWISQSLHLNCQLHLPTKSRNLFVQKLKTIWLACFGKFMQYLKYLCKIIRIFNALSDWNIGKHFTSPLFTSFTKWSEAGPPTST